MGHITGFGRTESSLQRAQALGVVDSWSLDLGTAVEQAEVVVIASPVNAISSTFQKLKSCLGDNAIVTDAGSVKGPIVDAAVSGLGDKIVNFVPGHPIAGKEQSGVDAASATLFKGHRTILTPIANTGTEAISTVKDMWETIGAEVVFMEPSVHDELLALTSHLPHALAFILVDLLSRQTNPEDSFDLSAGGFYDITRIASGDPVMWRDIFLSNQQHHELKTNINHRSEHCKSSQLVKSILLDKSNGTYQGKIYVDKDAQKTNGYQLSKALVLSENSAFNSKPELEIYADDVKCSHGATSGSVGEDSIYYLMSRGLNRKEAVRLLQERKEFERPAEEDVEEEAKKVILWN